MNKFSDFLKSDFLKSIEKIKPILREIINSGGVAYLVGGSVRDLILKKEFKDIDIEVHNISIDVLQKCLEKFGYVRLVGKSRYDDKGSFEAT